MKKMRANTLRTDQKASNNGNEDFVSKKAGFISLKQARNGRGEAPVPKGNETVLPVFALLFS